MTVSLPSQSAMQLANSAASSAFASDRSAGGAADSQNGSAFDAMLGALDEPAPQTPAGAPAAPNGSSAASSPPPQPQSSDDVSPAAASWRSISAVHSLGSGVLVALDKRLHSTTDADPQPGASKAAKSVSTTDAATSALANIGWTSLIGGLTGAIGAPASGSPAIKSATAPNAGVGALIHDAMPSDAAAATPIREGAPNVAAAPVAVTVTRSITYLGLDPTARNIDATSGAPARPAAKSSLASASAQSERGAQSLVAPLDAPGSSSGAASGDQPKRDERGGANQGAAVKTGDTDQPGAGQAPPAVALPGVAQAGVGAMSSSGAPLVPLDQLANVVASAAGVLSAQISDVASADGAANGAAARTAPVKELDVQLNPASLGALSIQMRLSNGNLSVTIKADKLDTLKLIENESGAISDKLKSLNFSLDSLTVKASDAASGSAGAEASNTGTAGYGEAQQGQSGQTADGSREGRLPQGEGGQRQPSRQGRQGMGDAGGDDNFGHRVV